MGNYRPVSSLPFGGKALNCAVALQLQGVLGDADTLVNELRRDLARGSAPLLILLDFAAVYDAINHGIPFCRPWQTWE